VGFTSDQGSAGLSQAAVAFEYFGTGPATLAGTTRGSGTTSIALQLSPISNDPALLSGALPTPTTAMTPGSDLTELDRLIIQHSFQVASPTSILANSAGAADTTSAQYAALASASSIPVQAPALHVSNTAGGDVVADVSGFGLLDYGLTNAGLADMLDLIRYAGGGASGGCDSLATAAANTSASIVVDTHEIFRRTDSSATIAQTLCGPSAPMAATSGLAAPTDGADVVAAAEPQLVAPSVFGAEQVMSAAIPRVSRSGRIRQRPGLRIQVAPGVVGAADAARATLAMRNSAVADGLGLPALLDAGARLEPAREADAESLPYIARINSGDGRGFGDFEDAASAPSAVTSDVRLVRVMPAVADDTSDEDCEPEWERDTTAGDEVDGGRGGGRGGGAEGYAGESVAFQNDASDDESCVGGGDGSDDDDDDDGDDDDDDDEEDYTEGGGFGGRRAAPPRRGWYQRASAANANQASGGSADSLDGTPARRERGATLLKNVRGRSSDSASSDSDGSRGGSGRRGPPAAPPQQRSGTRGRRMNECERCGAWFKRMQDLKRHGLTHETEKRFGCPLGCATRFTRNDALQRHVRVRRCLMRAPGSRRRGGGVGRGAGRGAVRRGARNAAVVAAVTALDSDSDGGASTGTVVVALDEVGDHVDEDDGGQEAMEEDE
ncbi:hypothetical protein HK405_013363, partial [Cladochytrium tenue]